MTRNAKKKLASHLIKLQALINASEDWLVNRVVGYGKERDFTKYTSTLEEAWRLSVAGLSKSLITAIENGPESLERGPEDDYRSDPAAAFGVLEAQKHRSRGVTLAMFLGLMKYYRQSYIDLVMESELGDSKEECRAVVVRFFDRVEIAFCTEWSELSTEAKIDELQTSNRYMTNEKNKYLTIFESLPDAVIFLDKEHRINNLNLAAAFLLEEIRHPGEHYYADRELPKTPIWMVQQVTMLLTSDDTEQMFEHDLETYGKKRFFVVRYKRMLDISGKFEGTIVIMHDVTKRKEAEEAVARSRDFYLTLLDDFPSLIWRCKVDGEYDYFNRSWLKFRGRRIEEESGDGWAEGIHPDDLVTCVKVRQEAINTRSPFEMEYRLRRHDGKYRWIVDYGRPFTDLSGDFAGYIGSCFDITERREQEQELEYLAAHDPLTGLANRRTLEDELKRVAARARRGKLSALLFLDIDNFKDVNDSVGHAMGDEVLIRVSECLQEQLRTEDLLVRLGGDEFAVVLQGTDMPEAIIIAERIRMMMSEHKIDLQGRTFKLTASIGLVTVDGKHEPGVLLSLADAGMYEAKDKGRNQVVVYP